MARDVAEDSLTAIRDWIRVTRLAGGVHDSRELMATCRSVAMLFERLAPEMTKGASAPFHSAGKYHLWAYMVVMANAPKGDVELLKQSADKVQAVFGRLAKEQPPGMVRSQLEKAARMEPEAFEVAMMAVNII